MKKTLIITDLTQMPEGRQVCVVGIDHEGKCIRPVCEGGFLKDYLYDDKGELIIKPGARVQFDLSVKEVLPPHIEDMLFDPNSIISKGICDAEEWENTLKISSCDNVGQIYDDLIHNDAWVLPGAKTRSIGTLVKANINDLFLTPGSVKPRLTFTDSSGEFERPVSELTMWDRCRSLVRNQGQPIIEVKDELLLALQTADRLYIRLGLARPWEQDQKCWLQITGVYTFPDYLGGKCFNDF